jgi:hypothetical protein
MFTMAASGGGTTGGGGGPPGGGGGPPGGGGGGGGPPAAPAAGPPAPPPTLDDLTRLMQDVGNAVGILAQQVLDLTCHGSAGTPLRTHAIGQDSGLEESRKTICT